MNTFHLLEWKTLLIWVEDIEFWWIKGKQKFSDEIRCFEWIKLINWYRLIWWFDLLTIICNNECIVEKLCRFCEIQSIQLRTHSTISATSYGGKYMTESEFLNVFTLQKLLYHSVDVIKVNFILIVWNPHCKVL